MTAGGGAAISGAAGEDTHLHVCGFLSIDPGRTALLILSF